MIIKIKDDAFKPMKNIGTVEFDDVKVSLEANISLGKAAETILEAKDYEDLKHKLAAIEELFDVDIDTTFSVGEYDCNHVDGYWTLDYYYEENEDIKRFEIWFSNDAIHTLIKGVESEFPIYALESIFTDTAFASRKEIIAALTYTRLVSTMGLVMNFDEWKNKYFVNQFIENTAG